MPGGRGEAKKYCKEWIEIANELIDEELDNPSDEVCAAVYAGCLSIGASKVSSDYFVVTEEEY